MAQGTSLTAVAAALTCAAIWAAGAAIKIDSHISATTSDCYERVALGRRGASEQALRAVAVSSLKQCERECNLALDRCGAFSFGIGAKGNGSCELFAQAPPRHLSLREDPDWDTWRKRAECRVQPPPDYATATHDHAHGAAAEASGEAPAHEHEHNHNHDHDSYGPGHDAYGQNHAEDYGPPRACFRLLATGRRVSERLVRASLPAAALPACMEACERERRFSCEALNFRAPESGRGGACELLSTPVEHLRPGADLVPDRGFSVYRRDRDGPPGCDPNELLAPGPGGAWGNPGGQRRPPPPYRGGGYGSGWSYGGGGGGPGGWDRDGGSGGGGGGGGGGWSVERPWRPPGQIPGPWADDHRPPPPQGVDEECFVRWRAGFRLERSLVSAAVPAESLAACRAACESERRFPCAAFSLRYSAGPGDPCLLTEASASSRMRPYHDLLPDRDYDVFMLMPVGRAAREDQHCLPPAHEHAHGHPTPGSECFRRLRSGLRLARATVRDSALASSLAECELLCLRARFFLCRAFSFRFGPGPQEGGPGGGPLDSCLLSDWPAAELGSEGPRALAEDPSAELYERGSYGLGCEIDGPPVPPPHDHGNSVAGGPGPAEEVCYAALWEPAALLPHAVRSSLAVHSEAECRAECSRARRAFLFFCSAASFRSEAVWGEEQQREEETPPHHNCLLSDIEQRDLRPGQDYTRRPGHRLAAWNPAADPRCHMAEEAGAGSSPHELHGSGGGPPPHTTAVGFPFPERDAGSTWRYFTVAGRPCRRGTQCAREPLGGFWGCEVEGGDHGQWDYCCRPDHRCGFSEGYDYPWCYVGSAGPEQWRPCSDHYFPYQQQGGSGPQGPGGGGSWGGGGGAAPWNRPFQGGPGGGGGSWGGGGGGNPWGNGPWNGGSGGPGHWSGGSNNGWQSGGWAAGGGRRWPVAYLHREMPPNATGHGLDRYDAHAHSPAGPGFPSGPTGLGGLSGPGAPHRAPIGLDVGFDNYVDAYRSGYGKKLEERNVTSQVLGGVGGSRRGWSPAAAAKPRFPADRQFVLGVSLTSGGSSGKDGPPATSAVTTGTPPSTIVAPTPPPLPISFEVVDQPEEEEDADSGSHAGHGGRVTSADVTEEDSSTGPASTEGPSLAKLQPRLAAGSRRAAWQRISSSNDRPRSHATSTTPAFVPRRRGARPVADFFSRESRQ